MVFFILSVFLLLCPADTADRPETDLPVPLGGVYLEKNLFIDRAEITNMQWVEYLHALKQDSSREAYLRALPDTALWDSVDESGLLKKVYLRYLRFRYYPVVGITYEQAVAFNKWRSVKSTNNYNKYKNKTLTRKKATTCYKVIFKWRLPSVEEWERAAGGGLDPVANPYGVSMNPLCTVVNPSHLIIDSMGHYRPELRKQLKYHLRYNPVPDFNCLSSFGNGFRFGYFQPHHTPIFIDNHKPISVNDPNKYRIYDIIGNVAEMTSEKGVAKGGSWAHLMQYAQIKKSQKYESPMVWLGFRSVCEVTLEPVSQETARLLTKHKKRDW